MMRAVDIRINGAAPCPLPSFFENKFLIGEERRDFSRQRLDFSAGMMAVLYTKVLPQTRQ